MTHPAPIIYVQPGCTQCNAVRRRLTAADVPFIEAQVDDEIRARAAAQTPPILQAPIVTFGAIIFGGFDPDAVDAVIEAYRATMP